MTNKNPIILWFRLDLRLHDNPALNFAIKQNHPILPIYIVDENDPNQLGGASKWWLHKSLENLAQSLDNKLVFFKGNPKEIIHKIINETNAIIVLWNRCYDPYSINRDSDIKKSLQANEIEAKSFSSYLLREPHTCKKKDQTQFKVFTPFYKQMYLAEPHSIPYPESLESAQATFYNYKGEDLQNLNLMPKIAWYRKIDESWQPGEQGAIENFERFLDNGVKNYTDGRNRPDLPCTSKLSPHIHFGEISIRHIWHKVLNKWETSSGDANYEKFLSELAWREFSYYILYHFPELPTKNWRSNFDAFPWQNNQDFLIKWQKGMTGYPIVDAGIRELWQTGYMHNRLRMIVGSFLVKHLLLDWREGEKWFWDCLVDADMANNAASWQWVAGCGADSSPYFRIFNPITQGQKFDPDGLYTKKYVPELANLPTEYLFNPWQAPSEILRKAGVILGETYPKPVIDHISARQSALEAFAKIKNKID